MSSRIGRGLLAAALLCLTFVPAWTANAQDPPSWTFEPTNPQSGPGRNWFVLEVQPGQVLRDSVTLANPLDEPLSFQLYPADAYNTAAGGAFTIRDPEEPREDLATWITLGTDAYTVPPGQEVVIPFELRVPENAEAGDHVGGIAAKNVNPESTIDQGGVQVDIKRVVGTRVYARVAGPLVPSLKLEDVTVDADAPLLPTGGGDGQVTYTVTNTGNVRLTPTAKVTVTGLFSQDLYQSDGTELQELLPGSSQTVTEPFDDISIAGPMYAKVEVEAPDTVASAEATTWVIPWLAVLAVMAVLALLAVWRRRRRRQRRAERPAHIRRDELVSTGAP
jgi:hypothetical protein